MKRKVVNAALREVQFKFISILIRPVIMAFLMLCSISAYSQEREISGIVTDQSGETIVGATVRIKETTRGTTTDAFGNYSINVKADDILEFSFIGYRKTEIPVRGLTTLDVALETDIMNLDEFVVIGYNVQKKLTLSGSIVSVGSEDLKRSPNASVANTLAGRVTGLSTVQWSGQPGADDPDIFVRGVGSLTTGRSTPLMLVDGVERSFTQIDPNEIETITVLKDASATAVYGIRGANGVIIVTTKRGSVGAPKVRLTTSFGGQAPTRLLEFADSYTYALRHNEASLNDDPNALLKFTPEAVEAFRTNRYPEIYSNSDWMDILLKPVSFQTQNNINITGGSDLVKYFFSVGYLQQDGMLKTWGAAYDYNYGYKRYNYRANVDVNVSKTTTLSLTTGGRSEGRNEPIPTGNTEWNYFYTSVPYSGPGIVDGKYVSAGNYYIPGQKYDGLGRFYGKGFVNSLRNVLNFDIEARQKLDYITKGLLFRVKYGYNSSYDHRKTREHSSASYEPYFRATLDPAAPGDSTIVYMKNGTDGLLGYNERFDRGRNWYMEGGLSYNRSFLNHNVTGLLLYNQRKQFYPATFTDIPMGYLGLVGRATYDYRTKYIFDFNLGYNGSENFAPDKRFGFFPAISGAWVITEENFMQNIGFLGYLKIRASYGIVGNDNLGGARFLYMDDSYLADAGRGYNFGTENPTYQLTAYEGRVGNPGVTWEKAKKQNYGIDFSVFQGKVAVYLDYFSEHRNDILTTRGTVPLYLAIDLPAVNIGEVKNHGYEIELLWRDKINHFQWVVNPKLSFSRNKILFIDEVPQPEEYLHRTGHRVNQPFLFVWDGFWTAEDVARTGDFPDHLYNPMPGDMRYVDINKDGIIDVNDRLPIGFPNYPEYTYGLTVGLNYKGLDFNMLWSGATNVSRLLNSTYRVPFGATGDLSLLQVFADGRWTPETAATASYPRLTFIGRQNNLARDSDFWQKDASYLRLKNAEIGYRFTNVFKKIGISEVRVFVNGYNLVTFDKLKIADPEGRTGANSYYPVMKIYNTGLNVTF